jgi:preprotein translocase subunit YajC
VVGKRVSIRGLFGVVFKVSSKHVAIAYDDRTWEAMTHEIFAKVCAIPDRTHSQQT